MWEICWQMVGLLCIYNVGSHTITHSKLERTLCGMDRCIRWRVLLKRSLRSKIKSCEWGDTTFIDALAIEEYQIVADKELSIVCNSHANKTNTPTTKSKSTNKTTKVILFELKCINLPVRATPPRSTNICTNSFTSLYIGFYWLLWVIW